MVELRINGNKYKYWKSATINRGIESVASDFSVSVAEDEEYNIEPGDLAEVYVNEVLVATCYVDAKEISYDSGSHEISIKGRSLTGQLVDCSEHHKTGTWKNKTPTELAKELVSGYGISVVEETNTGGKFKQFTVEHGESSYECLERIARERNYLLMDTPKGELLLTKPSKNPSGAFLKYGYNILSCSSARSMQELYSKYIVKGHQPESAKNGRGEYKDSSVKLFRPLVIIGQNPMTNADCKKRAEWEAKVRKARSDTATYSVQGWAHENGLWLPNTLVHIDDPKTGRNGNYLITEVSYKTGEGEITDLTVMPPEAFDESK